MQNFTLKISEMRVFVWSLYVLYVQSRRCAYIFYMYVHFLQIEISYFGRNSTIATVRSVLGSARPLSWVASKEFTEFIKSVCPTI